MVLFFYVVVLGVLAYSLVALLGGRGEALRWWYKIDRVEVPSLAICPFKAETALTHTESAVRVRATRFTDDPKEGTPKAQQLEDVKPSTYTSSTCTHAGHDRECLCLDLQQYLFRDPESGSSVTSGWTSVFFTPIRDKRMELQGRIEVALDVGDPSEYSTLKVGFYDSVDKEPSSWTYMHQGDYVIGSLELQTWGVTDVNWEAVKRFLHNAVQRKWNLLYTKRHMYKFASQEVPQGKEGVQGSGEAHAFLGKEKGSTFQKSRVSYEMNTFLVEETYFARSSLSLYAIGVLLLVFVGLFPATSALIDMLYPKEEEEETAPENRKVSRVASGLSRICGCCCCCFPEYADIDAEEAKPLVP